MSSALAARSAGSKPKIKIVSSASAKVKMSTRLFTVVGLPRGNDAGNNEESRSIPHIASRRSSNPPITEEEDHSMITLAARCACVAGSQILGADRPLSPARKHAP